LPSASRIAERLISQRATVDFMDFPDIDSRPASDMHRIAVACLDLGQKDRMRRGQRHGSKTDLTLRLESGQAVRIFTGGLVPEGEDAILIQENARVEHGRVQTTDGVAPGLHVREQGLDYRDGGRMPRRSTPPSS
jgi:molybdopterin biosynthesis enzyme